jgi:apolipoprotein N-acyltransferase
MPPPDREVGERHWRAPVMAVGAGLALGASFVDFRLWPLPWLAVAPLVALAETTSPRRAFRVGWLAGAAGIACAFSWLIYAFRVFGGFSLPVAIVLFVAPVAWMSLQIALFMGLLAWIGPLPLGLAAPVTFTVVELAFPTLFPWRVAHTQGAIVPLLQSAELAGPYLLGFAIVWVGAGIAHAVRRAWTPLLAAATLVLLLYACGAWRMTAIDTLRATAPVVRVGVIQGNIGVERKGDRSLFRRNLDDYRRLSRDVADRVDLLVWPETVVQRPLQADALVPPADAHPFPAAPRPLVFGGLTVTAGRAERQLYNSAFLLDAQGTLAGRYDKRVLVPFGEYLPFATRFPSLRRLSPATGHFTAGSGPALLTVRDDLRIGALICYEDVIPAPAREAAANGATLLLNLTNDAWYGASAEPYQHQALALWRAVETRRDFIRSTNTGLTTAISATGRILGELPIFEAATLEVEARLLRVPTFYAQWGDVFAWAVVLVWSAVAVRRAAALKSRSS